MVPFGTIQLGKHGSLHANLLAWTCSKQRCRQWSQVVDVSVSRRVYPRSTSMQQPPAVLGASQRQNKVLKGVVSVPAPAKQDWLPVAGSHVLHSKGSGGGEVYTFFGRYLLPDGTAGGELPGNGTIFENKQDAISKLEGDLGVRWWSLQSEGGVPGVAMYRKMPLGERARRRRAMSLMHPPSSKGSSSGRFGLGGGARNILQNAISSQPAAAAAAAPASAAPAAPAVAAARRSPAVPGAPKKDNVKHASNTPKRQTAPPPLQTAAAAAAAAAQDLEVSAVGATIASLLSGKQPPVRFQGLAAAASGRPDQEAQKASKLLMFPAAAPATSAAAEFKFGLEFVGGSSGLPSKQAQAPPGADAVPAAAMGAVFSSLYPAPAAHLGGLAATAAPTAVGQALAPPLHAPAPAAAAPGCPIQAELRDLLQTHHIPSPAPLPVGMDGGQCLQFELQPGEVAPILARLGAPQYATSHLGVQVVGMKGWGASSCVLHTKVWALRPSSASSTATNKSTTASDCSCSSSSGSSIDKDNSCSTADTTTTSTVHSSAASSSASPGVVGGSCDPPGKRVVVLEVALKLYHLKADMPAGYQRAAQADPMYHPHQVDEMVRREKRACQVAGDRSRLLTYLGRGTMSAGGAMRAAVLLELGVCSLKDLLVGPEGEPRDVSSRLGAHLLSGVWQGMEALHENHLAWQDGKCANVILVEEEGRLVPKLADFGWTRTLQELAECDDFVGTRGFVAPEVLLGARYTLGADTWMLCCILLEMRRGKRPFWWLEKDPPLFPDVPWFHKDMGWPALEAKDCPYNVAEKGPPPLTALTELELALLKEGLQLAAERPDLVTLRGKCIEYFKKLGG